MSSSVTCICPGTATTNSMVAILNAFDAAPLTIRMLVKDRPNRREVGTTMILSVGLFACCLTKRFILQQKSNACRRAGLVSLLRRRVAVVFVSRPRPFRSHEVEQRFLVSCSLVPCPKERATWPPRPKMMFDMCRCPKHLHTVAA